MVVESHRSECSLRSHVKRVAGAVMALSVGVGVCSAPEASAQQGVLSELGARLGSINDQLPLINLPKVQGDAPGSSEPAPSVPGSSLPVENKEIANVPARTSIAVVTPTGIVKTANADEARPGLSLVKLYMAHYVLQSGNKSDVERQLAERMIRYSDDGAASAVNRKYPQAISSVAKDFGLKNTVAGAQWGSSYTSATDVAVFLFELKKRFPQSPILGWMNNAAPVAADGTAQNWGTANLPRVTGTKWGWSDYGVSSKASASIAPATTVASFSWGGVAEQNADVKAAAKYIR